MTTNGGANRELRAEATISLPPERVWELLTDFSRMPDWSPELVRMIALRRGGLRVGQWYLGINRRKAAVWPTRSVVSRLEPGRAVAWDTTSSGVRWIWELTADGTGTRVVHRRPALKPVSALTRLFAPIALGGVDNHADELEAGMAQTVARLKAAAESG
jgi:uncharacterized protein YndB with AHSA1/START domain